MDVHFLANHLLNASMNRKSKRYIVGIVGIPSSGKSFIARRVTKEINEIAKREICEYIGMDGFHYTRKHLDTMKNAQLAHQKRGAHWTFDCVAFGKLLKNISMDSAKDIIAPTFDHKLKDPSPNGKIIHSHHRIIIVEGLYLFLDILPWKQSSKYFDERWLLKCDWRLAEERIIQRHIKSKIAKNKKDALFRWTDNDKPNGEFLLNHLDIDRLNVIMEANSDGSVNITNIRWKKPSKL